MKRGFTLPEMLVVIAVILILCGLIFPAVVRWNRKMADASCISRLHQLQVAVMTKTVDGGHTPRAASHEWYDHEEEEWKHWDGWVNWRKYNRNKEDDMTTWWYGEDAKTCIKNGSLYDYVGNTKVYICPKFEREIGNAGWDTSKKKPYRSYSVVCKWGRLPGFPACPDMRLHPRM